jgi:hypothetical protein
LGSVVVLSRQGMSILLERRGLEDWGSAILLEQEEGSCMSGVGLVWLR